VQASLWGSFVVAKGEAMLLEALQDFEGLVREAALQQLIFLRNTLPAHLQLANKLAAYPAMAAGRDDYSSDEAHSAMAAFLNKLMDLHLDARLDLEQDAPLSQEVQLHTFTQGDAEAGVGNIIDCYM